MSVFVLALRLDISVIFGFVSRSFFASTFESEFGRLGLLKPIFHVDDIAKINFSQNSVFRVSESIV